MSFEIDIRFDEMGDDRSATGISEGIATFTIDGKRFWPPEEYKTPGYKWSWVDMLSFLAHVWPFMHCDADIPSVLAKESPEELLDKLAQFNPCSNPFSLEDLESIQEFIFSHDLSQGLPGTMVPSLLFVPKGEDVWVGGYAVKTKMRKNDFIRTIEEFGDTIASRLELATGDHAAIVLADWCERSD